MKEKTPKKPKPKSEVRQKNHVVGVRLSAEEMAEAKDAAEDMGLTVASLFRVTFFKKVRTATRHRPQIDRELVARAVLELGKIGNNLNQIAKRLNERKSPQSVKVIEELTALKNTRESILKALRGLHDCEGQKLLSCSEPRKIPS